MEHESTEELATPGARPSAVPDNEPTTERSDRPSPRIYVASLSDYNNGHLHGVWLDAARPASDIHADIVRMLESSAESDAEEFAIHDFDEFGTYRVEEYADVARVAEVACGIAKHGSAFGAWAEMYKDDPEMLVKFEEYYLGHYASLHEYTEELIDELGYHDLLDSSVPDNLRPYVRIDTDALARDMYLEGSIDIEPDGGTGVWLFHSE